MKGILLTCLLLASSSFCLAQAIPDTLKGFTFMTDQDFFNPARNEDRNYTLGLTAGLTGAWCDNNYLGFPFLRKQVDKLFFMRRFHEHQNGTLYFTGLQLFGSGFTPRDIGTTNVIRDDRPFASIAGLSSSRTTVYNTGEVPKKQSSLTTRFAVGMLGLRIAEVAQSWIHKNITPERDIPKGWPNQISDGGEPTLLYQIQYNRMIDEKSCEVVLKDGSSAVERYLQATWMAEANAGWYTNIAAGLGLRLGKFYTPYYRMTSSGMMNSIISQAPKVGTSCYPLEFNFFLNIRTRAVIYNQLLQGGFKQNVYSLDASQVSHLLFELETGIWARYRKFSLSFQPLVMRTAETTLPQKRTHYWGTVFFSVGL